jgi:hypothetical protein
MTDKPISQSDLSSAVPMKLIQQVRTFIQDFAPTNELFQGQEVTDELIGRCIVDTIDDWNGTPPILAYQISGYLLMSQVRFQGVRKNIVDMSGARVLRILSIKHARNDIPFTAGNVNVQSHSIWRNLENIIGMIKQDYDTYKAQFKLAENLNNCYTISYTEMWDGFISDIDGY